MASDQQQWEAFQKLQASLKRRYTASEVREGNYCPNPRCSYHKKRTTTVKGADGVWRCPQCHLVEVNARR